MPRSKSAQNLIELNIALIFISTSGALGRYIDMPVPITIGSRAMLAGFFIYLFCKWRRFDFCIKKEHRLSVFLGGLFMGFHWVTYFYSLRLSNVAIGMLSLFTYPVITTFLEPILLKTRLNKAHLFLGLLVVVGIYFLTPELNFKSNHTKAILLGIISATFYSLRNIISKSKVKAYNGSVIMFYQVLTISGLLLPFCFFIDIEAFISQLPSILVLAILTTTIGHTLFLYSLRNFTVTSASIISSAQPIYGIVLGILFLKEFPTLSTLLGGSLILASVILESIFSIKKATSN